MKALFIGGTGTISMSITHQLAHMGVDLTLINRGQRSADLPENIRHIRCDINDEAQIKTLLANESFDVVADFIAFTPEHVQRDFRIFEGRCQQYIFISSASAYQKPVTDYIITESTPLHNPYWQYSRDKIKCEELLVKLYREHQFPITIVRPSHTYADGSIPFSFHGPKGIWTEVKRMMEGQPLVIHGDGQSLWTVTHSLDFAKGFIGLMSNIHAIGHAIHITSDESLTWNQIYMCIGRTLGVTPHIVHATTDYLVKMDPSLNGPLNGDKACSVVFDNSKIKRLVPEFSADIRFDQGIVQSVNALMQKPVLQVFDPEWNAFIDKIIDHVG